MLSNYDLYEHVTLHINLLIVIFLYRRPPVLNRTTHALSHGKGPRFTFYYKRGYSSKL